MAFLVCTVLSLRVRRTNLIEDSLIKAMLEKLWSRERF